MRTCFKVRLCPRNGEATAGLTELTINYSNNMYWYVYTTDMCITKNKNTREHKSTVSSVHIYVKFTKYSGLES